MAFSAVDTPMESNISFDAHIKPCKENEPVASIVERKAVTHNVRMMTQKRHPREVVLGLILVPVSEPTFAGSVSCATGSSTVGLDIFSRLLLRLKNSKKQKKQQLYHLYL